MSFFDKLNDVFFPSGIKCIVCGCDIPHTSKYPVCKNCELDKNTDFCLTCGRNMTVGSRYCTDCKNKEWSFRLARAPFIYCNNVKLLIHRLKYGNCKYLAKELSVYLADTYYEHSLMSDIITFVPMFFKKKRKRGYNQAEELARALGKITGCEVKELLIKTHETKSNARQNAKQREHSVAGTIAMTRNSEDTPINIKGKRILLIDDVFTTGATARECGKVLIAAKAAEVNVLTLATSKQSDKPSLKSVSELKDLFTENF